MKSEPLIFYIGNDRYYSKFQALPLPCNLPFAVIKNKPEQIITNERIFHSINAS